MIILRQLKPAWDFFNESKSVKNGSLRASQKTVLQWNEKIKNQQKNYLKAISNELLEFEPLSTTDKRATRNNNRLERQHDKTSTSIGGTWR